MTYYPGFFEDSLLPKDETFEPHPTDQHEMIPKKKFEDEVLGSTELRTVVIRPGFVYGMKCRGRGRVDEGGDMILKMKLKDEVLVHE
jgi:hypothetical protein